MEDTAYRIIIMAQADQALHHIVLHVKQSFSNEIAKSVYQDIKDRILLLADNPYMGMIPRHTVLRNKNYRMLIINKNIILYHRVFDDEKEVRIYNIFSQRQDYLQLLQGL